LKFRGGRPRRHCLPIGRTAEEPPSPNKAVRVTPALRRSIIEISHILMML